MVISHFAEDGAKRPHAHVAVVRNGHMVFATLLRREPYVAASLARDLIAIPLQPPGQITTRKISWYPHAAITSSRTKWSRMSFGTSPSS